MLKTDIEFSRNTLYVTAKGIANKKNIIRLSQKLHTILHEYGTMNIMIDIKDVKCLDEKIFNSLLAEYDIKYGEKIKVVE